MDGDGRYTSLTHPTSRSQPATKKIAWAATSRQRRQTGFTSRDIQFFPQSKQHDVAGGFFETIKGDFVMKKYLLAVFVGVGLLGASSYLLLARPVAAQSEQSPAVFNADCTLQLPTGFRKWVFVGAPLTPNGLNNGKANFPEYHHVYIEQKNVDAYLKTGEFPEGTVIVKELTRVLDPTFPDGSRKEPSGRGFFNGAYNGIDLSIKDSKRFAKTNGWG